MFYFYFILAKSVAYINEVIFMPLLTKKLKIWTISNFFWNLMTDGRYKYTSSKIKNEIISSCGDFILEKIVKEVNFAKCVSVLNKTNIISHKKLYIIL